MADDLGALHAAEALVEWVLSEDVWHEPVNLDGRRAPGASGSASGEPVLLGGHEQGDQCLGSAASGRLSSR
ncbi:hypothetical protein HII36_22305 [Nonomuraea sp. NN258]|uniref:hypothetical protein n=1 Tax=Nonomuraea antri TaxID=2730852 RepID=UPI0015695EEE|nr:hypothetical protein [Nonomuraea antri]NRQ34552.1 hypothetical protein [Nonomuraea antri]